MLGVWGLIMAGQNSVVIRGGSVAEQQQSRFQEVSKKLVRKALTCSQTRINGFLYTHSEMRKGDGWFG